MEVTFQTKQESNKKQRAAFLALSGSEWVASFFELSRQINKFHVKNKIDKTIGYFILKKKKAWKFGKKKKSITNRFKWIFELHIEER